MEKESVIRMPSFGTVSGLKFENGGYAEVSMGTSEVNRLLDVLIKFEEGRPQPNLQILESLRRVSDHYFDRAPELLAEAVIGAYRVEFNWVPRES